jgi:DNA-binding response OmpR family regulator
MEAHRILIVDDEAPIRTVIVDALSDRGHDARGVSNAVDAIEECQQRPFDLVLVDQKLPGKLDGLALLREIHRQWEDTAVIMLTGYASLDSAILALREGAADYLIKPASISQIMESVETAISKSHEEQHRRQLIAHLEETLRELKKPVLDMRSSAGQPSRFVQTPLLTMDRQKRLAVRGDEELALTATEFDLLDYLVQHADRVVTAQELVKAIQGYDLAEADARPIVRVHIQRLRQKLEDDSENPRYILNVRGKGYRFVG